MIEQAIIGGLMLYPEEIQVALDVLHPEDFRNEKAKRAFTCICEGECSDPAVVNAKTDISYEELNAWMDNAGSQSFFRQECSALKERSKGFQLADLAREIMKGKDSPSETLALVEKRVAEIAGRETDKALTIREILKQTCKDLEYRYENKGQLFGMPTGFPDLDKATTGIHPGELWIVAGRPGMGKSSFGVNVLEGAAKEGKRGRIFSTEMKMGQLVERMLSSQSKVNFGRIRSGDFQDADWSRMSHGMGIMNNFPITVDECPGVTLQEIKSRCRKQKREGLDIVVIDYLQRMNIPGDNRSRAVGEVSRALKDLAMELDMAVILLSQLNRSLESRHDKRPLMSDLRDSGEIEQDADVILFPYREAVYCQKCKDKVETSDHNTMIHQAKAELIIEKQRNGAAPINVPVVWLREFVKFETAARREE